MPPLSYTGLTNMRRRLYDMRIVVLKSPKMLCKFLRILFHMDKKK